MKDLFLVRPRWMDEELVLFDDMVQRFIESSLPPERLQGFRDAGIVDRAAWKDLADAGLLGLSVMESFGGPGGDFRHDAILTYRLMRAGADGFGVPLHNAICAGYIQKYGTDSQRASWLPKIVSGEVITAIAMTEPGAGSDLQGIRTIAKKKDGLLIINGQKTFITNGQLADVILVVAKTAPEAGSKGISLVIIDTRVVEGFDRGRNLDKIGMEMGDTSELFFNDVIVSESAILGGTEGQGLRQLMAELPKERLIIAIESLAIIDAAILLALDYVHERKAFGNRILDFQNTQFQLAECKTEAMIARCMVDECILRYHEGTLDAETASMAKYWVSECAQRVVDRCLQFFGGYGYMNEYPIAQLYKDVRVKRIYGGTTEIMKLLIARNLSA